MLINQSITSPRK